MDQNSIIYAELSLALPVNRKGEGAQNHKHGSTGPISVCTEELTVKDRSILVASLDLLKDELNQSTLRNKNPCKRLFFFH